MKYIVMRLSMIIEISTKKCGRTAKNCLWRLDSKYYAKREMVVLGWILRQVGGID